MLIWLLIPHSDRIQFSSLQSLLEPFPRNLCHEAYSWGDRVSEEPDSCHTGERRAWDLGEVMGSDFNLIK